MNPSLSLFPIPRFLRVATAAGVLALIAPAAHAWTSGTADYTPSGLVSTYPSIWSSNGNTYLGSDAVNGYGIVAAGARLVATNGESIFWSNGTFYVKGTLRMQSSGQTVLRGSSSGVAKFDQNNSTSILENVTLSGFNRIEVGAPGAVYSWSNLYQATEIRGSSTAGNAFLGFHRAFALLNSNFGAGVVVLNLSGVPSATNAGAFVDLVSSKLIADNNYAFYYDVQSRVFRTDTSNAFTAGPGNFRSQGTVNLSITNYDPGLFDREFLQVHIKGSNGVALAGVSVSVFAANMQSNRMAGATNMVMGGVYTNGFVDAGMVRLTNATMLTLADGSTPQGYSGFMLLDNQAVMPTANSTYSATGFTYSISANYLGTDYLLTNSFDPYRQSGGFLFDFSLPVAIPEPTAAACLFVVWAVFLCYRPGRAGLTALRPESDTP